jgi:hypothetical protein
MSERLLDENSDLIKSYVHAEIAEIDGARMTSTRELSDVHSIRALSISIERYSPRDLDKFDDTRRKTERE